MLGGLACGRICSYSTFEYICRLAIDFKSYPVKQSTSSNTIKASHYFTPKPRSTNSLPQHIRSHSKTTNILALLSPTTIYHQYISTMASPSRTSSITSTHSISRLQTKTTSKSAGERDIYTIPSQYHPSKEPVKHVDSHEDGWHNVDLNSYLSVHAWRHKLDQEKSKKPKSTDSIKVKGMKWAATALRV